MDPRSRRRRTSRANPTWRARPSEGRCRPLVLTARSSDSVREYLTPGKGSAGAGEMSLESLFQHILCSENQAEQSRRALREVRSDITRCREKMKQAAEELNEEQVKLESKVQQFSEKSFLLQLLKTHENALERQCSEITNQRNMLLQTFESTKKAVTEEEDKFLKEITDFNNEYEITKKRELLMKENVRIEISVLENQANILKRGFEDEENEAIHTTKYLEAEKIKINEKPQNDAECLRAELHRERRGKERGLSSAGSLPSWPQWPELNRSEARSQELLPDLPRGYMGLRTWAIFYCFPRP
nr:coiled-coil domain-containing protein 172 isoform X3 [Oryctolagus cuniculus]